MAVYLTLTTEDIILFLREGAGMVEHDLWTADEMIEKSCQALGCSPEIWALFWDLACQQWEEQEAKQAKT